MPLKLTQISWFPKESATSGPYSSWYIYIYLSCDAIHLWSFMTKKHLCKVRPWNQKSFIKATLLRDNSGRQSLNFHFWLVSKSSELVGWLISQFPWSQQSWFKTSQDLQVSDWDWWNMIYMHTCFTKMCIITLLCMYCCMYPHGLLQIWLEGCTQRSI